MWGALGLSSGLFGALHVSKPGAELTRSGLRY
jgi:hypothetical protein